MIGPANSPSSAVLDLITATELEGVAHRRGYRSHREREGAWLRQKSATAPGVLWLGGAGPVGPFLVATDHDGVAREIEAGLAGPHPGVAAWRAQTIQDLDGLVDRIYRLSVSLPTHPLAVYERQLADAPTLATETEAMKKMRVGQDTFRAALMAYWKGACPLTGISEPTLLRASHIRPWAECDDAERLDVHNGLLLSALWDAAFDRGLVSFDNGGEALFAPKLDERSRAALLSGLAPQPTIDLRPEHRVRLADHRKRHGFPECSVELS